MITVPKRNIENFKRMLQCEDLFKQAELQKVVTEQQQIS